MSRVWKKYVGLIIMAILIIGVPMNPVSAYESYIVVEDFSDIESHWATPFMSQLVEMGIVSGYETEVEEDGDIYYEYYIKPDKLITRAEFSVMLAKALNLNAGNGLGLIDVGNHWGKGYIYALYNKGIVNGYVDGTFKPEAQIKRGEIVTMLTKALNNQTPVLEATAFADVKLKTDHWSYDYIQKAVSMKIIKGYSDGSFKPEGLAKRAEVMTMLVQFLNNDITNGVADEEILSVVKNYNLNIESILNDEPDLNNEDGPFDWSSAFQYVTGTEALILETATGLFDELASMGIDFVYDIELGTGTVTAKSDHTALVKQYGKLRVGAGGQDEIYEGYQVTKLMKENDKWLIYATEDFE